MNDLQKQVILFVCNRHIVAKYFLIDSKIIIINKGHMSSDEQFEIPLNFIQQNKQDLIGNSFHIKIANAPNFIDDLYLSDLRANCIISSEKSIPYKQKRKPKTKNAQQLQRLQKIKNLVRASNLKEKLVLDMMHINHHEKVEKQKNRIKSKISRTGNIEEAQGQFEYVDIINVEKEQTIYKKLKGVTYIDKNKLNYGSNAERLNTSQKNDQAIEIHHLSKAYNMVPFGESHLDKISMLELNKSIYDKKTYRFNVLWWQKDKLTEEQRKNKPFDSYAELQDGQRLDSQVIRQLKKNLKPLRRHKLISTKYARLAEFMPDPQGTLQSDGIQNGRMIETSSQDDMDLYQEYDRRLNEQKNPSGTIDLEESGKKKRKYTKNKEKTNQLKRSKRDNKKSQYPFQNDEIENKLKRALRRMNDSGWEQDKLFGKGTQWDKAIELE